MKKVEVEIPDGKCVKWVDGVLTLVDDKPKDITERIKTVEDACTELGDEHPLVTQYRLISGVCEGEGNTDDIIAYLKLRIITAALNEGWEPQFITGESRWYSWFDLITEDDYNNMADEEKCNVVGRVHYSTYVVDGLILSYSYYLSAGSYTDSGSKLTFKSEELAKYAAKQFIDIYKDFCFRNINCKE